MCLVRILFDAIFVPSIALSAMLLVAIVFAAISADTILPFTMLAETTEFAASWSAPTASSAIFACVIASSGKTGICVNVTTPLEAIDIASSSDVCPICEPLIFISSTVRVVSVPNSVTLDNSFGTTKSIVPSAS